MKLDKIAFANVVKYVMELRPENFFDPEDLDHLINIDVPETKVVHVTPTDLDRLLYLMAQGTQKIEAIKSYRHLTGESLKEAKDAVERYWVSKPVQSEPKLMSECEKPPFPY